MVEGATITFNSWYRYSSGDLTYGYMGTSGFVSLGVATKAYYSGATSSDGLTTFTVPAAADGKNLVFYFVYEDTEGYYTTIMIDNVCQEITGAPNAPVFDLAAGEYVGNQVVTITYPGSNATGVTMYYTIDGSDPTTSSTRIPITSGGTVTIGSGTTVLQAVELTKNGGEIAAVTSATYIISSGASTNRDYRGFYAWKVNYLSNGLTITVNGTDYTSSNLGNGVIVYPEEEVVFKTDNAEGNEVEFVALWAQAYLSENTTAMTTYASNNGRYKNAYERNFHKVNSIPVLSTYPYTVTTLNPDGTGTVGSITRSSNITCGNDMKLENMNLSMASYNINGGGKYFAIGRGVKNGTSNVASTVYGYSGASGSISDFTLRLESGQYGNVYLLYNSSNADVTSSNTLKMCFGSDYDRANESTANDQLTISGVAEVGMRTYCSSSSAKINVTVLSGKFGSNSGDTELYLVFENANTASNAKRTLEVFGGDFLGGIAGGIEGGSVGATTEVVKMRIRGGDIHQYLYCSGQHSTAYGTRRIILTGGTFDGWVSGGCYGTTGSSEDNSGKTYGDIYLYFGGRADQTSTAGVFGAGYGVESTQDDYYIVNKST